MKLELLICRTLTLTILLMTLSLSTVFSATPPIQQSSDAAAHLKRGKLLFNKNDFAGAIESYNKAIALKPTWAEAYLQRGTAKRMHGQLDGSVADYDKATELNPATTQNNRSVAEAYANHGQILSHDSRLEEAVTDFNKALKLYPADFSPYFDRAQARLLLEDFAGALADYDIFLNREKYSEFSRARAYLERGLTKRLMGRSEEGKEDVKEGVKLAGKFADDLLLNLFLLERRVQMMHQLRNQQHNAVG